MPIQAVRQLARLLLIPALSGALLPVGPLRAASQGADRCTAGQVPGSGSGFADLKERLGAIMGEPATCEFPDPNGTGDVNQQTTTGLAFWRKATNIPTFTNGWDHWGWTEAGLVYWTGSSIDPPGAGEVPTLATPEAYGAAADWETTGLTEPVLALYTPASGAFFARTATGTMRSDDGGDTWRPVPLPPNTRLAAADPASQAVLYAEGAAGLYRTTDDAANWQLVLPLSGEGVQALAVNSANPSVIHVGLVGSPTGRQVFRFLRSRDGGVTWEQLERREGSLCAFGLPLLQPHPTDPQRLFRVLNCYAGRTTSDPLNQSRDQGTSFTTLFRQDFLFAKRLVGGRGSAPSRWYLAADRDERIGGSTVWRSEDDGRTWTEVLAFERARLPEPDGKVAPDLDIGGLAYDPSNPDRVFAALAGEGEGVQVSLDGGASWGPLGRQDLGRASALALGIDGRNLYAATERGLWRLRLPNGAGLAPPS